jgi:hypothetical protein
MSSSKEQEELEVHADGSDDKEETTTTTTTQQGEPKPPLSAYSWFMKHKRIQIIKDNPDLTSTEIMKRVAQMWKTLDPAQQEVRVFESLDSKNFHS